MTRRWEAATPEGLATLAELVITASVVEGDPASRLASIGPGAPLGELVAWAWVFDPGLTHTLLVDHGRRRGWMPPGGRVGAGEHPLQAASRELFEETGIAATPADDTAALVDAVADVTADGTPVTTFGVAFVFEADPDAPLRVEAGLDAGWFPLDEPPDRVIAHHWARLLRHLRR